VGQTDRSFQQRYNEHKQSFQKNCHTSSFAQHLLKQAHPLGNIHNTMQNLHFQGKSAHFNTLERYHIHTEFTTNNHLNDSQNIFPNKIFETILRTKQQ
jgi:hypothetical protein